MYGVSDVWGAVAKPSKVASPRDLSRATKTIRAPIFASATAATSPIPEVPPVMTTVFALIALSSVPSNVTSTALRCISKSAKCACQRKPPPFSMVRSRRPCVTFFLTDNQSTYIDMVLPSLAISNSISGVLDSISSLICVRTTRLAPISGSFSRSVERERCARMTLSNI